MAFYGARVRTLARAVDILSPYHYAMSAFTMVH